MLNHFPNVGELARRARATVFHIDRIDLTPPRGRFIIEGAQYFAGCRTDGKPPDRKEYARTNAAAPSRSLTKRLIKSPKLYWSDTALAMFIAGVEEPSGAHLENLVLADLTAWRDAQFTKPQILYWRTASDHEVDFVIEYQRRVLPIEVKATSRPSGRDALGTRK
jgi:hypothetical protein